MVAQIVVSRRTGRLKMQVFGKSIVRSLATGAIGAALIGLAAPIQAKTITIRIASGHPPTVVYAGLMKSFFQPELK